MPASLKAVGVEQALARQALQDKAEFPRQVLSIPEPLTHALPQKGRLLVRGIPSHQHPSLAPRLGHQCVKTIARLSPQRSIVWGDPTLEQVPRALFAGHLLGVLARVDGNLPSAMVVGSYHVRAGA